MAMDSSSGVEDALVEQESIDHYPVVTFIDSKYFKAAAKGRIDPFEGYAEPLNLLLTPTKNTILHIHITQQPKRANVSVSFTEQILAECPSLLLQTNSRGETPLHMAARHGLDAIVRFLIDSVKATHQDIEAGDGAAKAMLRMENVDRETALHEAVRHNNPKVVQILTKEDPDYTYSGNRLGETPIFLAVERRCREMVFQILHTCSSPSFDGPNGRTALHEAVIMNDSEMTAEIIEAKRTLVKEADQQGWTPLHHASHFGHLSIVKQLLECDKSLAYIGDKKGMSPLHLAASRGGSHKNVVFSILEQCPDSHELVDHNGRNVLHFAVQSKSESLLTNMVKSSSNKDCYVPLLASIINQKDVDGNTPLHLLATYCFDNTALIGHSFVDKMAVNNDNYTPREVVLRNTDNYFGGFKGLTLCFMNIHGYGKSERNIVQIRDGSPNVVDTETLERTKASHIITSALVATVTFTAGFTVPGGYDSNKGTAILSEDGAFGIFIATNAMALLLSTCALFFYYVLELTRTNRSKKQLLVLAAIFTYLSIFLMLIAFTSAVFAVLHHSTFLRVILCVITGLAAFVCYFTSRYK